MTKIERAKKEQGYIPHVIPQTCGNCGHYTSKLTERRGVYGGIYFDESDKRCGIGGFAVKKMGGCKCWTKQSIK